MTAHAHWKERLTDNRRVHNELVNALSIGVPIEMCRAVARVEHAVGLVVITYNYLYCLYMYMCVCVCIFY